MSTPENPKSPHILNTSANLLGFCFIVLTSVKVSKLSESSAIDKGAAVAIVFFMTSCLLSFLAMRSKTFRAPRLERSADVAFLGGLIVLFYHYHLNRFHH